MKRIALLFLGISLIANVAWCGECKEFIELHSAEYLAKEYGRSAMWVLGNVTINIWEKQSPEGKGGKVGELLPGSRAKIIEVGEDDYKVLSPKDKSVGWVNKMQVAKTLYQDTETYEKCKPKK